MNPPSRRSCLSVPGSSARMIAKAPAIGADELVLDLEDAVVAGEKESAREFVVRALAGELRERQVSVRARIYPNRESSDSNRPVRSAGRDSSRQPISANGRMRS